MSRVSVVIPCYNQGHFLAEAIRSALDQAGAEIEVVVVDDGSTDSTGQVAATFPGIRYVRQPNRGLAHARNRGFEESTGDAIVFLDADDFLGPHAVSSALASLAAEPRAAMSFGAMQIVTLDGFPLRVRPPRKSDDHYRDLLAANYIPTPGIALIRRRALEEHGLFDQEVAASADYDLWLRLARHELITEHPAVAVNRRFHPQAMTRDPGLMLRSSVLVHERHREHAKRAPELWKTFLEGERTWRTWYGVQVLTAARLHAYMDDAAKTAECIAVVLEYCPELLPRLVTEPFMSNAVAFEHRPELPSPIAVDATTLRSDGASTTGRERLLRGLAPFAPDPSLPATMRWGEKLVVVLDCVNHDRCSVAFLDGEPVETIWTSNDTLMAYLPIARLGAGRRHEIFFIA